MNRLLDSDIRKIWIYNIKDEQEMLKKENMSLINDPIQEILVQQQEQQQIFLANSHDILLFEHNLDEEFKQYLIDKKIEIPLIIYKNEEIESDFKEYEICPYIYSEKLKNFRSIDINRQKVNHELVENLNNKFFVRKLAENNNFKVTIGGFCSSLEELQEKYYSLIKSGFEKVVLKTPYGSSGKGIRVIKNEKEFKAVARFLNKNKKAKTYLIEGWHNTLRNINTQIYIDSENVNILSITEQKIDRNGVYLGTDFVPSYEMALQVNYKDEMYRLAGILQQKGYIGIIGVDSIITEDTGLIPIVEINARLTQVTYLLKLVRKLKSEFAESFILKFKSEKNLTFNDIKKELDKKIITNGADFFIYTFAKYKYGENTYYKIFILVYSNKIKLSMNDLNLHF